MNLFDRKDDHAFLDRHKLSQKSKFIICLLFIGVLVLVLLFGNLNTAPGIIIGSIMAIVTLLMPLIFGYAGLMVTLIYSIIGITAPFRFGIMQGDPYYFAIAVFILANFFGSAIIAVEVERNKKTQKILETLSVTDGLTEIYNHRYFQQRLDEEIARAIRANRTLVLCMIDIDNFKMYNDSYGHYFGDEILRKTAGLIQNTTRKSDIACRYGGDEFAVILPDSGIEEVHFVMERLKEAFYSLRFSFPDCHVTKTLTLSVGFSIFPDLAKNKDQLITQADAALYRAKYQGRNKIELYQDTLRTNPLN
ncbi:MULTISPECIES: GGDEF domain-containing protein [unclassified Dehalobacter]|uniref:GGDEF domain-containing protein n=1 Tax=unclassified Dehalobacter TaxID=2635733 RepID=UPI0003647BE5|nr:MULTISPECIES: GGDEF domain-containing protein [unclassified Dehalobacter]RJE47530.1 diguanylate cyclase [Dehalobacter sp. MCB1]TCX48659.1 GGDEF domain-containing protein [Dehalobacter sp. 14DCB1]TCX56293.1 GGDEF domain-containing protein [Dehalobacter sp. 12DCB1]